MNRPVGTAPSAFQLRLEQHPPEEQVYRAIGEVGNWLYRYLEIEGVTRGTFRRTLIDVIKETEPQRFTIGDSEAPSSPITFDGSRGGHQSYFDQTIERLELRRVYFPANIAIWIYTGEKVEAHVFVSNDPDEQRCLYPAFKLVERTR